MWRFTTGKAVGIYITRYVATISVICAVISQIKKRTVKDVNILSRKKRTDSSMLEM